MCTSPWWGSSDSGLSSHSGLLQPGLRGYEQPSGNSDLGERGREGEGEGETDRQADRQTERQTDREGREKEYVSQLGASKRKLFREKQ